MQHQPPPTDGEHTLEDGSAASTRPNPSRRRFLRWMGRVGTVVIGGAAGTSILADTAAGSPRLDVVVLCCHLARSPGGCPGSGPGYTCPSGYTKRYWYCCYGNRLVGCGECQRGGTTCFNGSTYACSEYWRTQIPCD